MSNKESNLVKSVTLKYMNNHIFCSRTVDQYGGQMASHLYVIYAKQISSEWEVAKAYPVVMHECIIIVIPIIIFKAKIQGLTNQYRDWHLKMQQLPSTPHTSHSHHGAQFAW